MNYYSINNNSGNNTAELEKMYPDIYITLYPFVVEAVGQMRQTGLMPTPERIVTTVDNIIRKSGLWDEDENENMTAQAQVANAAQPFRRGRRGPHNRNTLRDLVRILLLRELF